MFHAFNRLSRAAQALVLGGVLSLAAAGVAVAAPGGSTPAAHHQQAAPSPNPIAPGPTTTTPDQGNSDFTPAGEKPETPDPGEAKGEAKAKEAESANDPEPNHQDPNGANVDHTPAGEQPEAPSTGTNG